MTDDPARPDGPAETPGEAPEVGVHARHVLDQLEGGSPFPLLPSPVRSAPTSATAATDSARSGGSRTHTCEHL